MFRYLVSFPALIVEEAGVAAEELHVGYEHGWAQGWQEADRVARDLRRVASDMAREQTEYLGHNLHPEDWLP